MINSIWIAQMGEQGQGGMVIAVCDTRAKATKKALETMTGWNSSKWIETSRTRDETEWENSGDWITVKKWKVL